jgi:predicted metal-binding membrane protein
MAWKLGGTYFENCNCEMVCPCSTSGFAAKASYDRCSFLLVFHVDRGDIEGTDVSGLTIGLLGDSPQVMIEGKWRLGVLLDDKASKEQQEKLVAVFSGQKAGPMAAVAPLVSEMLGLERVPVKYANEGRKHKVQMGPDVHVEVEDGQERVLSAVLVAGVSGRPVQSLLLTREAAGLLLVAGLAWLAVIAQARGMSAMGGTMGLGLVAFIPVWTLMMAAMMLPSVAPVAVLYERSVTRNRIPRLTGFSAAYLLVWALAGVPAFAIAALVPSLAMDHPLTARFIAAGIFLVIGLYELSPLKDRCLQQCRSPLSLLLHYSGFQGPLRDVRAGTHHALYCLGCCWALMLVLVVAGIMNLLVMVILAAVVLIEKYWSRGEAFTRVVATAAVMLAAAAIWLPGLSPGLASP